MTTINLAKKPALQPHLLTGKIAETVMVDFSVNNAASSDVVQVYNVPAGMVVTLVRVLVVVAEGGTLTFDVGDGDDPNGYDDAVNGNATAGTMTIGVTGTDAYLTANGKRYTAADTIDLTLDNAADAAKIAVTVEGYYLPQDIQDTFA